jgi:hypothetical protein
MRFFDLLNWQHIVLYLFPTLVFIFLFGMALGRSHFRGSDVRGKRDESYYIFPDGVEDRRSPFPLALILIIVGSVVWGFVYILVSGLIGRKI